MAQTNLNIQHGQLAVQLTQGKCELSLSGLDQHQNHRSVQSPLSIDQAVQLLHDLKLALTQLALDDLKNQGKHQNQNVQSAVQQIDDVHGLQQDIVQTLNQKQKQTTGIQLRYLW